MAFSSRSPELIKQQLKSMKLLMDFFEEKCGVKAYLNGGTLLGAIRDNNVIPHDNDYDINILVPGDTIKQVRRNVSRICKILQDNDLLYALFVKGKCKQKKPVSARLFRLASGQMHVETPDRKTFVDVWVSCFINDEYYSIQSIYKIMKKSDVVPLTVGTMMGIEFPVPRDSEKILEHLYGVDWRVPQDKKPVNKKRHLWDIV